jgi:hypothetical protein
MTARTELERYLDQFRERLKRLVLARGGAVLAVCALLLTLGAVWFGTRRAFDPGFMLGARLLLLALIVAVAVGLVYFPLRALKRSRAVPEIERRAPEFDGRIETYEGLVASGQKSPFLVLLAEDALRFARKLPAAIGVSRLELSLPTVIAAAAVVTLLGVATLGPGNWRYGVRDLWLGWVGEGAPPPLSIVVEPGDITVRRGGDMTVTAVVEGFDPATMELFARNEGREEWLSAEMDETDDNTFELTFYAVRAPQTYYVIAAGVRSPEYSIDVVDLPEVSRIRLTYAYPDWTPIGSCSPRYCRPEDVSSSRQPKRSTPSSSPPGSKRPS